MLVAIAAFIVAVAGSIWVGNEFGNGWLLFFALIASFVLFLLALLRWYPIEQKLILGSNALYVNGQTIPYQRIKGVFQHIALPLSSDYLTIAVDHGSSFTVMAKPFAGQRGTLLAFRDELARRAESHGLLLRSLTYEQAHPEVTAQANSFQRFSMALLVVANAAVVFGWVSGMFPFKPYHPYLLVMGNLWIYWRLSDLASRMKNP